jgi:NAD(P)-dependent dehydrogenase (short-subunit alcohol dehydrogenase family)
VPAAAPATRPATGEVNVESLRGRVAVVTGGGSGIGRALALAFAAEGARLVLADVDERGMAETAKQIEARRGEAITVPTDVTRLGDVNALADRAYAAYGATHVLCNNAGVVVHGGLEEATHRDWEWVLGVNLWGVIHGLEAFLPRMIAAREPGHVVNTASMAGLVATRGLGIYNTSKYAVVGLSETLAKDLKPYRIGVSVLCPMGVQTQIRAAERNRPAALRNERPAPAAEPVELMGRTLAPETVAAMVLDAIHGDRLYVITHEEGLDPLRRRFARMEQSILERKPTA